MRALVQRVTRASVTAGGEVVGAIGRPGLVVLVGAAHDDGPDQVQAIARKVAQLRVLRNPADLDGPDVSVAESGAPVLVVSQFTLYADTKKGRRPSWSRAAPGHVAEPLVDAVVAALRETGVEVATGRFGADMAVELVNDGPYTLLLEA